MRRFILPLLAALSLPTAANAESVWLVLFYGRYDGSSMEKIKMKNMDQCEEQGASWMASGRLAQSSGVNRRGFECLEGE